MKKLTRQLRSLLLLVFVFALFLIPVGCDINTYTSDVAITQDSLSNDNVLDSTNVTYSDSDTVTYNGITISKNGIYDSKDEVALYIHTYNELPSNYITKAKAKELGWSGGSLENYASGCCIGGSTFGNNEGLLPSKSGRTYKECDIDTLGKSSRGAKRIVYSNDGLIYYTEDHYASFELLYGEE